jgi:TFIIF-interacting CTD phosphatase-like protein
MYHSIISADRRNGKTIILDLDETLVHTWKNPEFIEKHQIYTNPQVYNQFHPLGSQPFCHLMKIHDELLWTLCRPYLYEFLNFVYSEFDNVIIWSAGIKEYVLKVVELILVQAGLPLPKFVWSRGHCHNYQGIYHKPIDELTVVVGGIKYKHLNINPQNTIIVDDKIYTFMQNPKNGILIPEYLPGEELFQLLDRTDTTLKRLTEWFSSDRFRNATDLRDVDKSSIFK